MNSNLLRSKRVLMGYTQAEIAKKLFITPKTYNRKERGLSPFSLNEVIEITILLNLTMEETNEIFFENNLPFAQVSC